MRLLFKLVIWLIFLIPFFLLGTAWFAFSEQALVVNQVKLSHQHIARAQNILKANDPRHQPESKEHEVRISEQDLNLAVNYLLLKLVEGGTYVKVHPGLIDAVGTLRVPGMPVKPYLNFELQVRERQGHPQVILFKIGELNIFPLLAEFLLSEVINGLNQLSGYQLATNAIQQISMQSGYVRIAYQWNPDLIQQARTTLLKQGDIKALQAYHEKLLALQAQGIGTSGSLSVLLSPLFQFAEERSTSNDPIVENRSLLLILGAWASGHGLNQLVPESRKHPAHFRIKLEERIDFAQHFLTSAALSAKSDVSLADSVGLFKEISDSKVGSGFSFTDIAADRAGTRLGEIATQSNTSARKVQKLLARGIHEADIMPRARDLPESMNAAEFKRRFGDIGSPAYEQLMDEIEQRIAACRLYRYF